MSTVSRWPQPPGKSGYTPFYILHTIGDEGKSPLRRRCIGHQQHCYHCRHRRPWLAERSLLQSNQTDLFVVQSQFAASGLVDLRRRTHGSTSGGKLSIRTVILANRTSHRPQNKPIRLPSFRLTSPQGHKLTPAPGDRHPGPAQDGSVEYWLWCGGLNQPRVMIALPAGAQWGPTRSRRFLSAGHPVDNSAT